MKFFERFRKALGRWAAGVHGLGPPGTEAAIAAVEARLRRTLPAEYRDFLLQFDGASLFLDDYALFGTSGDLSTEGELLRFGRGPASDLLFDTRGHVLARDQDTEEVVIEGSGFERWLDATMAREAVIYDRDGEFREEAFDGAERSATAQRKRTQAGLKADRESPAWHAEEAARLADEGQREAAREVWERVVELDAGYAAAWLALGRLHASAGSFAAAAQAFARAAEAQRTPEEAGFAWAQAARAAREAGLTDEAVAAATQADTAFPGFVDEQQAAAEHLAAEGDLEGAIERLSLAVAVRPDNEVLRAALARARARRPLPML